MREWVARVVPVPVVMLVTTTGLGLFSQQWHGSRNRRDESRGECPT
jgi:hypothetical protein